MKGRRRTVEEILADLAKDPDFMNRAKERDRKIEEINKALEVEERPIINDLRDVGYSVKSVWDLVNSKYAYDAAIPVLVKHLLLPYSDVVRGGIARALAVPQARSAWHIILGEYAKTPSPMDGGGLGAKEGLAVALGEIATGKELNEIFDLCIDEKNGPSRILLLAAFKKNKTSFSKRALDILKKDSTFTKEIDSW